MAREKCDLLPMWVADMDFACPREVEAAIAKRAAHPIFGYTDQTPQAVEALLGFLQRHHGVVLSPSQQATLPCVVTGLKAAVRSLTQPGDGVLIQPPVYGPFFDSIRDNGRVVVESPLQADANGYYRMDFEGVERAFRDGVRLMLLCSPHNPVCRVWTREELMRLYGLCQQYDVTLISDEIHADFVYAPDAFVSVLRLDDGEQAKIAALSSASKTFNLAGLRQASLLTRNQEMRHLMLKDMKDAGVVSGNIFSFIATETAYRDGDAWLAALMAYLTAGRDLLARELAQRLPEAVMTPVEATYLAWLDLRAYGFSTAELMARTYAHGVAFTSGKFFSPTMGEGFLRFNFACPHRQTLEALRRLEKAIKTAQR